MRPLECGKYALASRCDFPGGWQPEFKPSGGAESEYYPQMALEYSETLGVSLPQSIHEKEMLYY